jgi:cytochrome c556
MLRAVLLAVSLLALPSIASAQNLDVIKERKKNFQAMGDAAKPTGEMLKGEADFDIAAVKNAIKVFQEKAALQPKLFPDDSKQGGKTEALPAIWENKADFEERFVKLAEAAKAADASITDVDTFEAEWPKVMGNCGGCHKKYRKPKD